jgi:hypothetical protein
MLSIEQNLALLEKAADEFESFILSEGIFWPLDRSGFQGASLPRLTLGGLSLTLNELAAQRQQMSTDQTSRYQNLSRKIESVREKWKVAQENKAIKELQMRINMWRAYLKDLEEKPEWIENYPQEVRTRVMVNQLIAMIGSDSDLKTEYQMIKNIDHRMRDFVRPGKFVWDDSLQPIYPQEKFPYLYMKPRKSSIH